MRALPLLFYGVLAATGGCTDALGFKRGLSSPLTCNESAECAPGDVCHRRHCLLRCHSDDECGEEERCDGTACVPTGTRCLEGAKRCEGRTPQTCDSHGQWMDSRDPCPIACQKGNCVRPDSCNDGTTCGDAVSCCMSDPVEASSFTLTYESESTGEPIVVHRSVKPFALDRFEVVVGRFTKFLLAYEVASRPAQGAGAAPGVLNSDWQEDWSDDPRLVPPNLDSLLAGIQACGPGWNSDADIPVRCVNWFVAAAFCIWDGGRLPSEAEWMAAALGGGEQREYPWTTPDTSEPLDQEHACFWDDAHMWEGPQHAGTRPRGAGRFGQHDLIGNVGEWVADVYHSDLLEEDCALSSNRGVAACKSETQTALRVQKGGSFLSTSAILAPGVRGGDEPSRRSPLVGFRCVRELEEKEP